MKTHIKNVATPTFHSHLLRDQPLNAAARKTALPAGPDDGDGWLEPLAHLALVLCLAGAFLACSLRVAALPGGECDQPLTVESPRAAAPAVPAAARAVAEVAAKAAALLGLKSAAPRSL